MDHDFCVKLFWIPSGTTQSVNIRKISPVKEPKVTLVQDSMPLCQIIDKNVIGPNLFLRQFSNISFQNNFRRKIPLFLNTGKNHSYIFREKYTRTPVYRKTKSHNYVDILNTYVIFIDIVLSFVEHTHIHLKLVLTIDNNGK